MTEKYKTGAELIHEYWQKQAREQIEEMENALRKTKMEKT